jgi:hypothetical protein
MRNHVIAWKISTLWIRASCLCSQSIIFTHSTPACAITCLCMEAGVVYGPLNAPWEEQKLKGISTLERFVCLWITQFCCEINDADSTWQSVADLGRSKIIRVRPDRVQDTVCAFIRLRTERLHVVEICSCFCLNHALKDYGGVKVKSTY